MAEARIAASVSASAASSIRAEPVRRYADTPTPKMTRQMTTAAAASRNRHSGMRLSLPIFRPTCILYRAIASFTTMLAAANHSVQSAGATTSSGCTIFMTARYPKTAPTAMMMTATVRPASTSALP